MYFYSDAPGPRRRGCALPPDHRSWPAKVRRRLTPRRIQLAVLAVGQLDGGARHALRRRLNSGRRLPHATGCIDPRHDAGDRAARRDAPLPAACVGDLEVREEEGDVRALARKAASRPATACPALFPRDTGVSNEQGLAVAGSSRWRPRASLRRCRRRPPRRDAEQVHIGLLGTHQAALLALPTRRGDVGIGDRAGHFRPDAHDQRFAAAVLEERRTATSRVECGDGPPKARSNSTNPYTRTRSLRGPPRARPTNAVIKVGTPSMGWMPLDFSST